MRGTSSEASGSSISRMRGCASSARPIATRCFSPPDSVPRLALQQRRAAQELDDARLIDEAIRGRAQPLAVEQVRFARPCAETAAHPGTRSRPGARSGGTSMRRAASNRTVSLMRIEPRCGVAIPAIALTTLVLPEPERPKRPTIGASAENLTSRWKSPSCCSMSTSIIALRLRGAAGEPFRRRERDDRQHDRDDAEAQRLRIAAGHLRERVDRQRQRLRLARECWIRT